MLERFEILTDTQASDVVTFYFKGTCVRCVVYGTFEYQINFFLLHNVAKCSRTVKIIILIECGNICGIDRHKHQADRTLLFEYIFCLSLVIEKRLSESIPMN